MRGHVRPRIGFLLACLLVSGCTSLREIPRTEYAALPERKHVRVVTNEDLVYEFDYVTVSGDTLTGFRRQETPGIVDDYASMSVPLEGVQRLSARGVDWFRTGLVGGGVIAAFVVKGLADNPPPSDGSTSGGGRPPTP